MADCSGFLLMLKQESEAPLLSRRTAAEIEKLLEDAKHGIGFVQTNCPNSEAVTNLRVHWLSAWIDLLEHDANKLTASNLTYELFRKNNEVTRWGTIKYFLKRSYLRGRFKPVYLRVNRVLDKIIAAERLAVADPDEQTFRHAKLALEMALIDQTL
jgi:hypothetical protein